MNSETSRFGILLTLIMNGAITVNNLEWLSHLSSLKYLDMSGIDLTEAVSFGFNL